MNLKKLKKILLVFVFIFLILQSVKSTTWETVSNGYWYNGSTWLGGIAPPYSSSDTFIIRHFIVIQEDIYLNTDAFVHIDSTGGLCGHHTVTVNSQATMLKYGIFEFDTLLVPGGKVLCFGPGNGILTKYAKVSNGGSFTVYGGIVTVGLWFNCQLPEYSFAMGSSIEEKTSNESFILFPNPSNGNFQLSYQSLLGKSELQIKDIVGRTVYKQNIFGESNTENIDATDLINGVYYWSVISNDGISAKGKIVIMK